jgi:hypothetical protein
LLNASHSSFNKEVQCRPRIKATASSSIVPPLQQIPFIWICLPNHFIHDDSNGLIVGFWRGV